MMIRTMFKDSEFMMVAPCNRNTVKTIYQGNGSQIKAQDTEGCHRSVITGFCTLQHLQNLADYTATPVIIGCKMHLSNRLIGLSAAQRRNCRLGSRTCSSSCPGGRLSTPAAGSSPC